MAKRSQITEASARAAKPKEKRYQLRDITGLYLEIAPSGRKTWRFRYTNSEGKRSWHTMGEYPDMTTGEARAMIVDLRQRAKKGQPLEEKPQADMTFGAVAKMWYAQYLTRGLTEKNYHRVDAILKNHILPHIGSRDITSLMPPDILGVMERLGEAGKHSTMIDARIYISHIFKFAAARGLVMYDPCTALVNAVDIPPVKHHPSPKDPKDVAEVMRAINGYSMLRTRLAVTFLAYSMCRAGEVLNAEWREIDMDRKEFRIAAEKMKKRRPHIVPLSTQLIAILDTLRPITGHGRYIFPKYRNYRETTVDGSQPMSSSTMQRALVSVGFSSDVIVPHGFRSMASTILNENGFNRDWIERQLAHVDGNQVRAAYNYADFLDDRRTMLQWYGDYLDKLRGEPLNLK